MTIILGSCETATPEDFDVMFADPPYSAHVHKNAVSQSPGGGTRSRHFDFDHLSDDFRNTIARFAGKVKRWSLIYSDIEGLSAWKYAADVHHATYIRPMAWVRWSMPQLSGDRPPMGFELVTCYWGTQKGRKSWNGPGSLTHLNHKCLRGDGKHKAEKPLDQALDLVSWFSNPGERVLDPCAGSGVIGLACKMLGREYVGYELDAEWAAKSTARIASDKLSERDAERFARWQETQVLEAVAGKLRAENTAKTRAKADQILRNAGAP